MDHVEFNEQGNSIEMLLMAPSASADSERGCAS
jgi:hypothetical protein